MEKKDEIEFELKSRVDNLREDIGVMFEHAGFSDHVYERVDTALENVLKEFRESLKDRTNWREVIERWNDLARLEGLCSIQTMSQSRRAKYRARLRECPLFWEVLERELPRRGEFYRERMYPSFDQVLKAETFTKIYEGQWSAQKPQKRSWKP